MQSVAKLAPRVTPRNIAQPQPGFWAAISKASKGSHTSAMSVSIKSPIKRVPSGVLRQKCLPSNVFHHTSLIFVPAPGGVMCVCVCNMSGLLASCTLRRGHTPGETFCLVPTFACDLEFRWGWPSMIKIYKHGPKAGVFLTMSL